MDALASFFNRFLESLGLSKTDEYVGGPAPAPLERKVALITYNPTVDSTNRLRDVMHWNDPDTLVQEYISDLEDCSYGFAQYKIVERFDIETFPLLEDGYSYSIEEYLNNMQTMSGFHRPEMADYSRIIDEFDLVNKVNNKQVEEVWLMGFPFAGFYESRMVGRDAFWCNGPAITPSSNPGNRFIMMGFNYERGVGEMLEDFCHRTESIMEYVYRKRSGENNLWHKYIRYEKNSPGKAEVGNVHYAPNSLSDYDWGNTRQVLSRCDTWHQFPDLSGQLRLVDCREWGNGDIRQHHIWWLRHLPHVGGDYGNISNNWWRYIINPDEVI